MKKYKGMGIVLILVVLILGIYFGFFLDRTPPVIKILGKKYIGREDPIIQVYVTDKDSYIKNIHIKLTQGIWSKKIDLPNVKGKKEYKYKINIPKLGIKEGVFSINVSAADNSINNFLSGNQRILNKSFILDTTPPSILMKTYRHNLVVGGAGVAGFMVSEPVSKIGIKVDKYFFPAYPYKGSYCCFFAIPYDVDPKNMTPWVIAIDRAGNEMKIPLRCYIKTRRFLRSKINITDKFLQQKMVQYEQDFKGLTPLQIFLKVNKIIRKDNRARLRKIGLDTEKKILFSGPFLRQPRTVREASFGTKRTYIYKGRVIDRETHLGVDLASTARAPILAANNGRVVFAGWYGIYGNAVIIDHGYGVQSLYGHLSYIKVKRNDLVKKGEIIGNSGATGLAGGDHLHFAILISGVPVDPVEWWDKNWLKNNILYNLKQLSSK